MERVQPFCSNRASRPSRAVGKTKLNGNRIESYPVRERRGVIPERLASVKVAERGTKWGDVGGSIRSQR